MAGSAEPEVEDVRDLKPGQFVWYPERAEAGPVAIVVSLPDQLVYVYRDGIRIGVSTCATGRPGHATPTGVFTILQKDKTHHSSLYNDASMPLRNVSPGRASRSTPVICRVTRTRVAASTCRSPSPS